MTVCYWCGAKDTLADIGKELDDGKYKMVQCRKCKNAYYVVNMEKMNKPKPQTNEEYIQTCNMEQLAEELLAWWFDGANTYSQFGLYKWEIDEAKDKIAEWLKQPHREE